MSNGSALKTVPRRPGRARQRETRDPYSAVYRWPAECGSPPEPVIGPRFARTRWRGRPITCFDSGNLAFFGVSGLPHHLAKAREEIMTVARAGRGLRMVLHREDGPVLEREAAIGAVEQRHMRLLNILRQRILVDREAVVHRGDLDLAGGEILHRMIGAVVTLMHLHRLAADCDAQHLMAEADAEGRRA